MYLNETTLGGDPWMVIQSVPSGHEGLIPTLANREPSLVRATTARSLDPSFFNRDSQLTVRDSRANGCGVKKCYSSSLHYSILISFFSFFYSWVCYSGFGLSICDVIVVQKSSSREGKFTFYGWDYSFPCTLWAKFTTEAHLGITVLFHGHHKHVKPYWLLYKLCWFNKSLSFD